MLTFTQLNDDILSEICSYLNHIDLRHLNAAFGDFKLYIIDHCSTEAKKRFDNIINESNKECYELYERSHPYKTIHDTIKSLAVDWSDVRIVKEVFDNSNYTDPYFVYTDEWFRHLFSSEKIHDKDIYLMLKRGSSKSIHNFFHPCIITDDFGLSTSHEYTSRHINKLHRFLCKEIFIYSDDGQYEVNVRGFQMATVDDLRIILNLFDDQHRNSLKNLMIDTYSETLSLINSLDGSN